MTNTPIERLEAIISAQRAYYASEATRGIAFRKTQLRALKTALKKWEKPLGGNKNVSHLCGTFLLWILLSCTTVR